MADSVSLLDSGDHGNVATVMAGVTPQLAGWKSGAVPLPLQSKGDAVDVSGYTTLRTQLEVTAMSNRHGYENGRLDAAALHVAIEHSHDGVTWDLLHQFEAQRGLGTQRIVLGTFEGSVRASWWFSRGSDMASTIVDQVAFTWSLTAEALPEAA